MSRFAALQGLICDADPQGVAQPPLQSTNLLSVYLLVRHSIYSYKKLQQNVFLCESVALAITGLQLLPCYKSQYYLLLK